MRRRTFVAAVVAGLTAPAAGRAQTPPVAAPPPQARRSPQIEPQNELEESFIEAFDTEALRPAFRRTFLASDVALAISAREPGAPPRSVQLRPGLRACLIFTSSARARAVMGQDAPFLMMTGRAALERVRGANVIININLNPTLVLEPEDVDEYLALAAPRPAPPPAPAPAPAQSPPPPRLAGPSQ